MDCLTLLLAFGAIGALEPILGVFLVSEFNIAVSSIAYIFIVPTAAYPITVVVINKWLKKVPGKALMLVGLIFCGFAMILIGPCTLTGFSPMLGLTIFSIFMLGSGMALTMIPSLPDMLADCASQLPQIEPSLISDRLSGLISLSIFFGKAFAAPFSGTLKDLMAFQDAIAVFGVMLLVYSVVFGIIGGGFRAMTGMKTYRSKSEALLSEKEMVEAKKSFYLLEEDEV